MSPLASQVARLLASDAARCADPLAHAAPEPVLASGPPPELSDFLPRARLRRRRQLLAHGRLVFMQRKMALPKTKPEPPPPEPEDMDRIQAEGLATIRQVDRILGLDRPIPPPNGTNPPRTVYPHDYFYPDGTPLEVPFPNTPHPGFSVGQVPNP
jgi:hypothetical protein